MVRLIRKVIKGKEQWVEQVPVACFNGHEGCLLPSWSRCPVESCGEMTRLWRCSAVEAGRPCTEVLIGAGHVHNSLRSPE